jgi:hypothetical protein
LNELCSIVGWFELYSNQAEYIKKLLHEKQEVHGPHRSPELSIYDLGVRISTILEIFGHFLY